MTNEATPSYGVDVFDVRKAIELDRQALPGRLLFAAIYAGVSLLVMPWTIAVAWIGIVVFWEAINFPIVDRILRLSPNAAVDAFAATNVVGSLIYAATAGLGLATDSPIGVAIGATWLCGSFMNCFIYGGENRKLLWASLVPGIVVTIVGPMLYHGPSIGGAVVSALILTALLAARSFSIDHQVLLQRLADRQGALADVEGKLAIAVEASGDGLFEVDLISGQSQPSTGWKLMLGYAADGATDADLMTYVHPDDRPALTAAYGAHFQGETTHTTTEVRLRCNDGGYKWVLSRSRLVARTAQGEPWRLIGTTIDISARKAMEHQLETALDIAERANAAKDVFVANISHEIRTPLNGVLGMAQAMAGDELSMPQRERLDVVRKSGEMLLAILNDVLDLAKIEAGKLRLESEVFAIGELASGVESTFSAIAQASGLSFDIAVEPYAIGAYRGDGMRVRQIMYNLISNALKFTMEGCVKVVIAAAEPGIEIQVSDTGIGIAAERLGQLFRKFEQADASTTRRFGGTGLGLAISRELAELMGGSIAAKSIVGEGSTFTVLLPLERVAAEARSPVRAADHLPAPAPDTDAAAIRILAAEDNQVNQLVLRTLLNQAGLDPTIVPDGRAAVDAWETGDWDVILMDVQMPVMDGMTAARTIRDREIATNRPRTPIIALTANAMLHQVAEYSASGMDRFVAKPIDVTQLFAAIAAACEDAESDEAPLAARR